MMTRIRTGKLYGIDTFGGSNISGKVFRHLRRYLFVKIQKDISKS